MKTFFVVTGVIENNGRYLLLKKSPDDYNYPNKWSFCSGFVKEFESGEDTCLREIKEETGLDAQIVKTGKVMEIIDKDKRWILMTFLCKAMSTDVKLDKENTEFAWVSLEDFERYDFVPGITKNLKTMGL